MDLGLEGKIALVCAASKGLGRACAIELAREGAHVAICGRDPDSIALAHEAIAEVNGDGALGVVADVGVPADLDLFVDETIATFGASPDIVIWNGGGPAPGPLLETHANAMGTGIRMHLMGALHLFQRTIPAMQDNGFGRVVAITSVAVKQPLPGLGTSNTVRAGLHGMLKTLAAETARYGVTVNAVCPGYTLTERLQNLANAKGIEVSDFAADVPAQRLGRPHEFAAAVTFLASERAAYITGQSLAVDGGFVRGLL